MFRDILQNVEGINTLPIFMLIFCFLMFIGILIIVWKMDKSYASFMSNLPLADSDSELKNREEF